jgi:hypothetical protein
MGRKAVSMTGPRLSRQLSGAFSPEGSCEGCANSCRKRKAGVKAEIADEAVIE